MEKGTMTMFHFQEVESASAMYLVLAKRKMFVRCFLF